MSDINLVSLDAAAYGVIFALIIVPLATCVAWRFAAEVPGVRRIALTLLAAFGVAALAVHPLVMMVAPQGYESHTMSAAVYSAMVLLLITLPILMFLSWKRR